MTRDSGDHPGTGLAWEDQKCDVSTNVYEVMGHDGVERRKQPPSNTKMRRAMRGCDIMG